MFVGKAADWDPGTRSHKDLQQRLIFGRTYRDVLVVVLDAALVSIDGYARPATCLHPIMLRCSSSPLGRQ